MESPTLYTNKYSGSGFITISKYNKNGDSIYIGDKESKNITMIDSLNASIKLVYSGHNGIINDFILHDDKNLISCSGDMTVIFWNIDGTIKKLINEDGIPKFITIVNENNINIVVVYCQSISRRNKPYLIFYNAETTEIINKITLEKFFSKNFTALNSIENYLIAGDENGNLYLLDYNNKNNLIKKEIKLHDGIIKSIVLNSKKNNILTSSIDKTSKIVDIELNILNTFISDSPINYATFYAKDRKVILGGGIEAMLVAMTKSETNNLKTKIYNIKSQKLIKQFVGHFGPLRYIDTFDKNFITAGQDGFVKIHSFEIFDGYTEIIKIENMNEIISQNNITNSNKSININKNINNKTNKQNKPIIQNIVGMKQKTTNNITFFEINNTNNHCDEIKEIMRTIKLSNLHEDITENILYEQFSIYGNIDGRVKIIKIENKNYNENKHNIRNENVKNDKNNSEKSRVKYEQIISYINYVHEESACKAYDNIIENKLLLNDLFVKIELVEGKNYYK